MTSSDLEPARAWNGYEGRHWADHHDRYDAVNVGFDAPLLDAAAIARHHCVLDVGCGTGQLTRKAGCLATGGEVVGVDVSEPMVFRARELAVAAGHDNVRFELGDAQVHPLPPTSFDVVISRFGIMFFNDPVAAFTNIGQALRPGGRVALVSMRPLEDHDLAQVLAPLAEVADGRSGEEPAEPAGPSPFSLADPAAIGSVFAAAGFVGTDIQAVDAAQWWGRDADDAAGFMAQWGPIRHLLDPLDPQVADREMAAVRQELSSFEGPDGVQLRGAGWMITAERP